MTKMSLKDLKVPVIVPIPADGSSRPFWSVMIPTYNPPADYLKQCLCSVLMQDPGLEQMQIEVIDDCSTKVDVAALVQKIAGSRVKVFKAPQNLGLAGCWNSCIERSHGKWVHILHQDDYVMPGFYQKIKLTSEKHPQVALIATRSFIIGEDGHILTVSERLYNLENGGREVNSFFYVTPIQCPGIVVKRDFYEVYGGFRMGLKYVLDREMWVRVINSVGGVVIPDVLSAYRVSNGNESNRLNQTETGLIDFERLNQIFASQFPNFSIKTARALMCDMAWAQAWRYSVEGNLPASKYYSKYWKKNATAKLWFRRITQKLERHLFN
jgi:glycosyltransferase involved in cell wall biosynthesis